MKIKLIIIVLLSISDGQGFAQVKNKIPIKMKYVPTDMILCVPEAKDSLKPFYISNHLTTNKEYFTFLLWMWCNSGGYFSKYYLEFVPNDEVNLVMLFHKEYSNRPVLGLSNKQILAFCQWKTSILNEYILVKKNITNQKTKIYGDFERTFGLENFVLLEKNLYDLLNEHIFQSWAIIDSSIYEGHLFWKSDFLYPNFRPPLKSELIYAINFNEKFRVQKPETDKCIEDIYKLLVKYWYENSPKRGFGLEDRIDFLIDIRIKDKSRRKLKNYPGFKHPDFVLNDSNIQNNRSFFYKYKKERIQICTETDSMGKMNKIYNLIIIDEENSKPVFIKYDEYLKCFNIIKYISLSEKYKAKDIDLSYSKNAGFRCVMFAPGY
ncbi:MAG: hypothetical protein ACOYMA_10260 [Bacteroidia bacterium]